MKSLTPTFQEFFASIKKKKSFWQGDWALDYHSMRFRHFLGNAYGNA